MFWYSSIVKYSTLDPLITLLCSILPWAQNQSTLVWVSFMETGGVLGTCALVFSICCAHTMPFYASRNLNSKLEFILWTVCKKLHNRENSRLKSRLFSFEIALREWNGRSIGKVNEHSNFQHHSSHFCQSWSNGCRCEAIAKKPDTFFTRRHNTGQEQYLFGVTG